MEHLIDAINPKPPTTAVIAGPWPRYSHFRNLDERDRWVMYGAAKAFREDLERRGIAMAESYDDFIKRVTDELEI
jgi:hypothetical protein